MVQTDITWQSQSRKTAELLARMIYGECTPEQFNKDIWQNRYEIIAFWRIVKNSCKDTKAAAVKTELLRDKRYSGLTRKSGYAPGRTPAYNINWARAVIIGTLYQYGRISKLKVAPGINMYMKYWHNIKDWNIYYKSKSKKVYFPSTGKHEKVTGFRQYANTVFYETNG